MNAFMSLPPVYRLAALLGARIEVYIERNKKWHSYETCIFSYDTPLRVVTGDESLLEAARAMVPQFYETVLFKDYDYLVPKVALKPDTIILFMYGFGLYARVQSDGSILEVSEEEHKALRAKENHYHVAVSVGTYMGTKDRGE